METEVIQKAIADTPSLKSWRADAFRNVVSALVTIVIFSSTGWPNDAIGVLAGFGVFAVSYLLATGIHFGWNVHRAPGLLAMHERDVLEKEVDRLRAENEQFAARDLHHEQRHELSAEMLRRSEFARKTAEASGSVWAGVVREQKDGHDVPFDAIMARMDIEIGVAQQGYSDFKKAS